jgi:hypothetical protein
VRDTPLVVRVNSRTSMLASRPQIVWLSTDWVTPSCAAARVKLRARATRMNACRWLKSILAIFYPDEIVRVYPNLLIVEILRRKE